MTPSPSRVSVLMSGGFTGAYDALTNWTRQQGLDSLVTVVKCDATAIKTAARSLDKPTFYLMKNATILKKWSYADAVAALPAIAELPDQTSK